MRPDDVDALKGVRDLESVYPLLHALVGRSLRDFFVRAAALESLVASGRASFGAEDFTEILFWLDQPARESVLAALRRSGWLLFEAGQGTGITSAGRWAHDVLSFLHGHLKVSELLPTVAGVDYALQIGQDPLRLLLSMRSRLVELRDAIESARTSFSEIVLRRAHARLADAMALSNDIRKVLDKIPLDQRAAREVVKDIHDHQRSPRVHNVRVPQVFQEDGTRPLDVAQVAILLGWSKDAVRAACGRGDLTHRRDHLNALQIPCAAVAVLLQGRHRG